jgi:hypothetical protein
MSDLPPTESAQTIGQLTDNVTETVADSAAANAAQQVAESIPPTNVVVEDQPVVTDPALALEYADEIRRIAREEANNNLLEWMALAEANKPKEPEVVVVEAPAPQPPPEPAPVEPPKPDKAPPKTHRYFQPLGKRGRGGDAA